MKITAKVLILFLLLLTVFAVGSGLWRWIKHSLPQVPIRQSVYQQPLPQGTAQPTPQITSQPQASGQQALPQAGQGSMIKAKAINPVIIEPGKLVMEKGKAAIEVYNVDCNPDDNIPPSPVFTGVWSDFDSKNIQWSKKSKKNTFTQCNLGVFHFYYQAPEDGLYVFGVNEYGASHSPLSWRANGVLLFPLDFYGVGTETVQLKGQGWYEMDIRLFKNADHGWPAGFTLMVKLPSENEMHILTKDEVFFGKAIEAPAATTKGGK